MLRLILVAGILFAGHAYLKGSPGLLDELAEGVPAAAASTKTTPSGLKPFSQAKREALAIYADRRETFYCGCRFTEQGLVKVDDCGYAPRKNAKRGKHIEWEHVMPAWRFGHERACWRAGGRDGCRDTDPAFRAMEGDLHNLVPAIGELNGDRSNYGFAELPGEARRYGQCDFEVDPAYELAEPRPEIRGDIARIYFYMAHTYGLGFSPAELAQLTQWAEADPVDDWERERNRRIRARQGNGNPYIDPHS